MPRRPLPLALVPLAACSVVACSVAACGPRLPARPAPAPARPTPAPATTPAAAPAVAPASRAPVVAYEPGFAQYVVTSRGAVHVEGDSLGARDDSVETRARLSLRVSPASAPRGVVVTIDSFLVSAGRGQPLAPAIAIPIALQAQLDDARRRVDFLAAQPMLGQPCAGPGATLLAVARELVVALPAAPVAKGQRWSDSTTTSLCRSGVPLTVTSRHEWQVADVTEEGGRVLVRLRRETQSGITGRGTGRRAGATVDGSGRSTGDYVLDAATGRLASASVASTAELRVRERDGGPLITTRQEARQDVAATEPWAAGGR